MNVKVAIDTGAAVVGPLVIVVSGIPATCQVRDAGVGFDVAEGVDGSDFEHMSAGAMSAGPSD